MRRRSSESKITFNFLPQLGEYFLLLCGTKCFLAESVRNVRDATLDVLELLDNDPVQPTPTRSTHPVDSFLQQNSVVDCASATMPLKVQTKKRKKKKKKKSQVSLSKRLFGYCSDVQSGRRWVYKYSSVCAGRSGQFRWPDDCHQYVDCWRGRGRS